jgi:hypothetical protein
VITAGPDGNLWFTEEVGNKIGQITPGGVITEFPFRTSNPSVITAGPDGNLWFTESYRPLAAGKIGRISPDGTITEFLIPTVNSFPLGITAGPDGNLWFVERDGNKIGRLIPGIDVTPAAADHFQVLAPASATSGVPFDVTVVAVDPFGNVDPSYRGTVTFTTSDPDPGVVLPANYTFTAGDAGTHTFTNTGLGETTLITAGDQMITVSDPAGGLTGNATVTVSSAPGAAVPRTPGQGSGTLIVGYPSNGNLLIPVSVNPDTDPQYQAAFTALMDEWTQMTDYATRVAHLLNGGGLNDPFLLNAATVHSNGGGNTLTGHGGGASELNLYFGNLALDMYDWDPATETFISV